MLTKILAITGLLALFGLTEQTLAAQVMFEWDTPANKTGIAGYFLGCGPATGNHGTPVKQPGANTTTGSLELAPGTWYCAAWSYGTPDTLVSGKSNEIEVIVPLSAPSNLRFTVTLTWDPARGIYVGRVGPVREVE
jgi:hypothetical protein